MLHKIEGQISRVNGVHLLSTEEGVVTISDDRSLRIYLKRDNEQFWPSIYHYLPFSPNSMHFDEDKLRCRFFLLFACYHYATIFQQENEERKDGKSKLYFFTDWRDAVMEGFRNGGNRFQINEG